MFEQKENNNNKSEWRRSQNNLVPTKKPLYDHELYFKQAKKQYR